MEPPPLEDPYARLGVANDASISKIKAEYRKLVLKYHPDKVQDDAKKAEAVDQFHKIQQAYEYLCDDEKRNFYDASLRLEELRKDVKKSQQERAARDGSRVGSAKPRTTTTTYDYKTSSGTKGATFDARGPARQTEERKPSYAYDEHSYPEDVHMPSTRYYDDYTTSKSKSASHGARYADPESVKVPLRKENEKMHRSEKSRAADRERTRERDFKYTHVDPGKVDVYDDPYRDPKKVRSWEKEVERERQRGEVQDEMRRYDADRRHKERSQEETAKDYQRRTNSSSRDPDPRPSASRTTSAKDAAYLRRTTADSRPTIARRSSARRSEHSPPRRSRKDGEKRSAMPEIVEESKRAYYSTSRSPDLEDMVNDLPLHPPRSYPAQTARPHDSAQPGLPRSHTMPGYPSATKNKKDGAHSYSSRRRETTQDSGYNSDDSSDSEISPSTPQPTQPKGNAHYFAASAAEDSYEYSNGRRTQRVEPKATQRKRSPSPREHRSRPSSRRQNDSQPTFRTVQYQYPSSTAVEPPSSAPSSVHPADPLPAADRPRLPRRDAYHSSHHTTTSSSRLPYEVTPTSPMPTADPLAAHSGGAKSSSRKSAATMMAQMAKHAQPVQYSRQPRMEDIRTSNPMGSKARTPSRRTGGASRVGLPRRETVF
ncbi:MAG: hypothetical protein M1821_004683 [Bathelium mastoideum]|nr:MAG: hypothetical protein M1821_004683 [Bathelium mastoideum]